MKQFITKSLFHFVVVVAILIGYIRIYDSMVPMRLGPNTKTQITESFSHAKEQAFPVVVLGNSRIYRGINPDQFRMKVFNFAHDDDSYNQMYYKLEQLYARGKIRVLILGVDYFTFSYLSDRRNYVYGGLLGDDYLRDYYADKPSALIPFYYSLDAANQRIENYAGFDRSKLLIRAVVFGPNKDRPQLKNNGQYIYPGKAKESDHVNRDATMLKVQKEYFERIISFCATNHIKLFLVMPPVRKQEMANYTDKITTDFDNYFSSFENAEFLNFANVPGFELNDFTDITHLNADAADRFSKMINDSISLKLDSLSNLSQGE